MLQTNTSVTISLTWTVNRQEATSRVTAVKLKCPGGKKTLTATQNKKEMSLLRNRTNTTLVDTLVGLRRRYFTFRSAEALDVAIHMSTHHHSTTVVCDSLK